jgi:hypothetical protein
MIAQNTNTALSSFLFWAENELLTKAEAYINYTSKLYYRPDPRLGSSYVTYASPFKQWVYNKSITGAIVCEQISGSINLNNNQSGMEIDYENGRIILPSSFGTGLNLTGSYAFKEINFYLSTETEENLLTKNKYTLNSRFNRQPTGAIQPYIYVNPAIYINLLNTQNEPFALGGEKNSKTNVSMIIATETMYQLDAVLGLFTDAEEKYIKPISIEKDPLNAFGNVKTGLYPSGFYYNQIFSSGCPSDLYFIDSVLGSKISDKIEVNDSLFVGIIDLDISRIRTT